MTEPVNVSFNRATIYGLIDAFGTDSKAWVGKVLTAHTEKTTVAGKRVTALYLVPAGFEVSEDDNGYVIVAPAGKALGAGAEGEEPITEGEDVPW